MREITFKHLTSHNHRRRDLWMQEETEENGVQAKVQKRCVYMIKGRRHFDAPVDVEAWLSTNAPESQCRLRNLTVTRIQDTKAGTRRFSFKAIGSFYAVVGEDLFSIAFVQTYRVDLQGKSVSFSESESGG